eukprot:7449464-Pyramimonas_sp.AAC.1
MVSMFREAEINAERRAAADAQRGGRRAEKQAEAGLLAETWEMERQERPGEMTSASEMAGAR